MMGSLEKMLRGVIDANPKRRDQKHGKDHATIKQDWTPGIFRFRFFRNDAFLCWLDNQSDHNRYNVPLGDGNPFQSDCNAAGGESLASCKPHANPKLCLAYLLHIAKLMPS